MPNKKTRSIGLKKILVGNVPSAGGMPPEDEMVQLGRTLKGTANFATEQDTTKDFYCEEEPAAPVESVTTAYGLKNLTFNILEWDNDALQRIFGGSVREEAGGMVDGEARSLEKYIPPRDTVTIEQSVRVITPFKKGIDIPRAKIIARFVWSLSREEIAQVEIVARALVPNGENDGVYEIYDIPDADPAPSPDPPSEG